MTYEITYKSTLTKEAEASNIAKAHELAEKEAPPGYEVDAIVPAERYFDKHETQIK